MAGPGRVRAWVTVWLANHRKPKVYLMVRKDDVSGVSGEGVIAQVFEASDGAATVHWPEHDDKPESTTNYPAPDGVKAVKQIHGHGDKTVLVEI